MKKPKVEADKSNGLVEAGAVGRDPGPVVGALAILLFLPCTLRTNPPFPFKRPTCIA